MASQQTHHEIEELLGAYALDALDADERALVDAHLPTCPRCRAEVHEHREVAALLANTGEPAPEGLWARIADSLEEPPPELAMAAPVFAAPARARRRGRSAWPVRAAGAALAAAACLAIAVLLIQVNNLNGQLDGMRQEIALASADRAFAEAVSDPDSVVVDLVSEDGEVDARAVVAADGTAYLRGVTLPRLSQDRTYQLWGVTPDDRVVSLGVFGSDPDYEPFPAAGEYVAFALTEELSGGVAVSEQPALASGEVRA